MVGMTWTVTAQVCWFRVWAEATAALWDVKACETSLVLCKDSVEDAGG